MTERMGWQCIRCSAVRLSRSAALPRFIVLLAPSGQQLSLLEQLGQSFQPLRAVSADQLPYMAPAPPEPEPYVDLSIYGVTVPDRRPPGQRLHDRATQDYDTEIEDAWRHLDTDRLSSSSSSSSDRERVSNDQQLRHEGKEMGQGKLPLP